MARRIRASTSAARGDARAGDGSSTGWPRSSATLAALIAVAVLAIVVVLGRASAAPASSELGLPHEGPADSSARPAAGSRRCIVGSAILVGIATR